MFFPTANQVEFSENDVSDEEDEIAHISTIAPDADYSEGTLPPDSGEEVELERVDECPGGWSLH